MFCPRWNTPITIRIQTIKPYKMKEFVFVFKSNVNANDKPSPEQMQRIMTDWMNWMASLAPQNKLAERGVTSI